MRVKNKTSQPTDLTREWFKDWSNEYDNTLGRMKIHNRLLDTAVSISGVKDGDLVLDLGCGTGLLSLKFLRAANCRIRAIDKSPEMLAIFRRKIEGLSLDESVTCKIGDAMKLRGGAARFDIVTSTLALHHVKNKLPMIQEIFGLLKPRGRFVLGEPDVDTTGDFSDVRRLKRVLDFLNEEWMEAMQDCGVEAFRRMYDNGKKHLFNQGEYCISMRQWRELCKQAGFVRFDIKYISQSSRFAVLVAHKPTRRIGKV